MKKLLSLRFFQNIKSFAVAHKIWTTILVLIIIFIGYKIIVPKSSAQVRYVTTNVSKGTVVSSVTGSGQIEASSTIDIKSKASGDIVSVNIKAGQTVKKGQTLLVLDANDAQKTLRDATLNLKIAENDLKTAQSDYDNTKNSQELSLKNQLLTLNSDTVAVPDSTNTDTNIVTLSGSYNSPIQGQYILTAYPCQGGICIDYSGLERGSFSVDLNVPKALGSRGLYVVFNKVPTSSSSQKWYIDIPSPTTTSYLSNLRLYTEKQESVKQAIDSAAQTVASREISLTQKQNALSDAKKTLSDYYVVAPFDGTIATLTAELGQSASSGTALGTIITNQKLASITLNEVDVAKIKLGQKATLTFDAISDLSIAGEVVSIDSVGTVSSGVVNYTVKISCDTDDVRIKPGMSVTAAIVTAVAQDVLTVANSAVKVKNGSSYVEIFDFPLPLPVSGVIGSTSTKLPTQQQIEVGISDNTNTEVKSGLKEGDIVVSRTITTTTTAPTSSAPSLIGGNTGRVGGNTVRNATR